VLTVTTFEQILFDALKEGSERFEEVALHQFFYSRISD